VRTTTWFNADAPPVPPGAGSTDYAINNGSGGIVGMSRVNTTYTAATDSLFPAANNWNGISFPRSQIRVADITDGTSNTYLIGEKYMYPDDYNTGMDYGDDDSCLTGYSFVQNRLAGKAYPPMQDTPGQQLYYSFGSAHSGGLNMAMCDGSTHTISYTIDENTHTYLGNRQDNEPIDTTKF
jgi:prepilin-type processing-associated H-X9-DG protein